MSGSDRTLSVCPLASGSKGNAYWIEAGGTAILVDAGISLRQLTRRVAEIGRDIREVDHVFVSHEHGDHVRALGQMLKHHRPVIWASRGTLHALRGTFPEGAKVRMMNGRIEEAGAFSVKTMAVSHDAAEPLALRFESAMGSVSVATDLGVWDDTVARFLGGADVLVCEANHDPQMLQSGPYPYVLKRRVASARGHLSNEDGARLAREAVRLGTRRLILAHLSETNNSPSLALDVFHETLDGDGGGVKLDVAAQSHPGPWIVTRRDPS